MKMKLKKRNLRESNMLLDFLRIVATYARTFSNSCAGLNYFIFSYFSAPFQLHEVTHVKKLNSYYAKISQGIIFLSTLVLLDNSPLQLPVPFPYPFLSPYLLMNKRQNYRPHCPFL